MSTEHQAKTFFKYYTAETAKKTLHSGTRKWSNPSVFNDPFDHSFAQSVIVSPKFIPDNIDHFIGKIGKNNFNFGDISKINPKLKNIYSSEEVKSALLDPRSQGLLYEFLKEYSDKIEQGINDILASEVTKISVFCVSDLCDHILMWSHYASDHKGAVVGFRGLREIDSPLILAKEVRYSKILPTLNLSDVFFVKGVEHLVLENVTLTKSDVWSYEREWRVISTLRDGSLKYELIPYDPREVVEIYFGCRMQEEDKKEIRDIVNAKYPWAQIYQMEKNPREFSLISHRIS